MAGVALVVVSPLLVVWTWCLRMPGRNTVAVFSRRFGTSVDDDVRPALVRAIRRGRCWRALGGSIGWPIAMLPIIVSQFRPERAAGFNQPFVNIAPYLGYLLGCLVAVVVARRAPTPGEPSRSRRPQIGALLPRWPVPIARVSAVVGIGLSPVAWAVAGGSETPASARVLVVSAVANVVVGLVAMELGVRFIAERRSLPPVLDPLPVPAVEDALRADAARRVAGVALFLVTSSSLVVVGAAGRLVSDWLPFVAGFGQLALYSVWWAVVDTTSRAPSPVADPPMPAAEA